MKLNTIVMGIGYYHRHRTLAICQICRFIGHRLLCTVSISVCRWYVCTYVYKEHVATEDVGLGLYVGSISQAAGAGSRRRLACAFT
jgi:hypothetical protein